MSIIEKGNLIKRIRDGQDLPGIFAYSKDRLFKEGPTNTAVLEILSYIKLFQPKFFTSYENEIIEIMGLYYKHPTPDTLEAAIFDLYGEYIKETYGDTYTPMQADIIKRIRTMQNFSFSAPTSTGKSFVFRNLIKSFIKVDTSTKNAVVVVVPSRALINEYFDRIHEIIGTDKTVNILTFVDKVNTKHAVKNIFILTPERARDLFKHKDWLEIEFILFDEAQLSDEESVRGLHFDSIVRRVLKTFPTAKCIFAHPFISNPEAQLKKNKLEVMDTSFSQQYTQKNVGQIFYVHDAKSGKFFHFGTDKYFLGKHKLETAFDPITHAIQNGGSVLIYVPKKHILYKSIYTQFDKYIKLCTPVTDKKALAMIEQIRGYIGASDGDPRFYNSDMLEKLSLGIVSHHGSLPLQARLILEHFTQKKFCRICFATSTLEQGINMPFDIVYLDRLEASKSLSVKNLIGRAGRSTENSVFDFGSVIVKGSSLTTLRKVMAKAEPVKEISHLDVVDDSLDEKYNEFKDAINNDTFSDEYNLTEADVKKLSEEDITAMIPTLLDMMFTEAGDLDLSKGDSKTALTDIRTDFRKLYEYYLGRELMPSEKNVLSTAIRILLWKIEGRTFKLICQLRYNYTTSASKRAKLYKEGKDDEAKRLTAEYTTGFHDLPDKSLKKYPIFSDKLKAEDVDYDLLVFDTYDYLDKLIGFKLSDLYYAMFHQYYKTTKDIRAIKLANYFRYGTADGDEIWMLRYGLTFEDIEWAKQSISKIGIEEIEFKESVHQLEPEQKAIINRFYYGKKEL